MKLKLSTRFFTFFLSLSYSHSEAPMHRLCVSANVKTSSSQQFRCFFSSSFFHRISFGLFVRVYIFPIVSSKRNVFVCSVHCVWHVMDICHLNWRFTGTNIFLLSLIFKYTTSRCVSVCVQRLLFSILLLSCTHKTLSISTFFVEEPNEKKNNLKRRIHARLRVEVFFSSVLLILSFIYNFIFIAVRKTKKKRKEFSVVLDAYCASLCSWFVLSF